MVRPAALALMLLLAACAHQDPRPAICDGKHRRPANPHGSALPGLSEAAGPGPQSSIDPKSFASCGGRA